GDTERDRRGGDPPALRLPVGLAAPAAELHAPLPTRALHQMPSETAGWLDHDPSLVMRRGEKPPGLQYRSGTRWFEGPGRRRSPRLPFPPGRLSSLLIPHVAYPYAIFVPLVRPFPERAAQGLSGIAPAPAPD